MSKQKKELVSQLCENVVTATTRDQWETTAIECIEDPAKMVGLTALPEIGEIAASHNLAFYPAALLYHSKYMEEKS